MTRYAEHTKVPAQRSRGEIEATLAYNLNVFWFGLMVGWSGGLHSQADVISRIEGVAAILLRGTAEQE